MGKSSSLPCFLEHRLIKPAAIILVVSTTGVLGWVTFGHMARAEARLDGLMGRPVLGMQVINPDELVARMFSFPPGEAVLVHQVFNNSPAHRAGLRRGDGIVAIDGRSIRSVDDVASVLGQVKRGDLLQLTVVRGGVVQDLVVEMARGQGAP